MCVRMLPMANRHYVSDKNKNFNGVFVVVLHTKTRINKVKENQEIFTLKRSDIVLNPKRKKPFYCFIYIVDVYV